MFHVIGSAFTECSYCTMYIQMPKIDTMSYAHTNKEKKGTNTYYTRTGTRYVSGTSTLSKTVYQCFTWQKSQQRIMTNQLLWFCE